MGKATKSRPHVIFLTLSDHEWKRVQMMARAQAAITGSSWYKDYSASALVRAALYKGFYSWGALDGAEQVDFEKEKEEELRNPLSYGHYRHKFGRAKLTEVEAE